VRLNHDFYERPALDVARDLLGKVLVIDDDPKRPARAGRIVEVEAYVGEHDLACHASKGRTRRTEVLFGPAGRSYVYLIYGMYHCFNVVTEPEGTAAAVLVRAVEPVYGIAESSRTDGPGKLCRAMHITLAHNRLDLTSDELFIEDAPPLPEKNVARGPRIGVDYSGKWAKKPYRLWVKGNAYVSRTPKRLSARRILKKL
jgi:DNA-3-methyladenine glycosylase